MFKDITLGQYFPINSPVHNLDARTKILLSLAYIVALFIPDNFCGFAVMTVLLITVILLSKIKISVVAKSVKPLFLIIAFTAVINIFFTKGETYIDWWIFHISVEGLYNAAFMIIRIVLLVAGTSMLTYTTSPIALTDGIERLMKPLAVIRFPVHDFAMMMSIAIRFIPTLIDETQKIMNAQKARGADFESGNILQRAKALIPVLVPMFISAFRRADDLALAMECRCYHGGKGRTKMNVTKMRFPDFAAVLLFSTVITGLVFLNKLV